MNLTNIEEMQDRLNELMELPKDKFPSVLKLVEDLENLYKENKQQKEVIQTYETLLKTNIEENKQLKDKINKVVEFINDINDWEICSKYDCIYKDDILEILKKLNINKGE